MVLIAAILWLIFTRGQLVCKLVASSRHYNSNIKLLFEYERSLLIFYNF